MSAFGLFEDGVEGFAEGFGVVHGYIRIICPDADAADALLEDEGFAFVFDEGGAVEEVLFAGFGVAESVFRGIQLGGEFDYAAVAAAAVVVMLGLGVSAEEGESEYDFHRRYLALEQILDVCLCVCFGGVLARAAVGHGVDEVRALERFDVGGIVAGGDGDGDARARAGELLAQLGEKDGELAPDGVRLEAAIFSRVFPVDVDALIAVLCDEGGHVAREGAAFFRVVHDGAHGVLGFVAGEAGKDAGGALAAAQLASEGQALRREVFLPAQSVMGGGNARTGVCVAKDDEVCHLPEVGGSKDFPVGAERKLGAHVRGYAVFEGVHLGGGGGGLAVRALGAVAPLGGGSFGAQAVHCLFQHAADFVSPLGRGGDIIHEPEVIDALLQFDAAGFEYEVARAGRRGALGYLGGGGFPLCQQGEKGGAAAVEPRS